jgi:predicted O-methyltransferase YrrM
MSFSNVWFDKHRNNWTNLIIPKISDSPNILELGSYEGRSSVWIYNNIAIPKQGNITCVDHWISEETEKTFDFNISKTNIKKYKSKFLPFLLNAISQEHKYDLIYLDGDHSASATLQHGVLSWLLLKNNGILIFDDYKWTVPEHQKHLYLDTKIGIDSFLSSYEKEYNLIHKHRQVMVQKI